MFLWGCYQIGNVVIVMNLLIALMNATIASIQEDKITQWRFARTQVIIVLFVVNYPSILYSRSGDNTLITTKSPAFLFLSIFWK